MPTPDILTPPDAVYILAANDSRPQPARRERFAWEHGGVRVEIAPAAGGCAAVTVTTAVPLLRVVLRWNGRFPPGARFLGDAWERSYGDLEWRGATPHRLMPWYFLAHHDGLTTGCGVRTGGAALACWQADATGLTLNLDLRSGGAGVSPGERPLPAAVLVQRPPQAGESPFAAARAMCAALCPVHLTPRRPVVGHNDWYWLYGKNSETLILEATRRFVELYPKNTDIRPWSVIDDGWQVPGAPGDPWCNGGPWDRGNDRFPDMAGLAGKIKTLGARPGIWMRPLQTKAAIPDAWKTRCPKPHSTEGGFVMDPSVPAVLDQVRADVARLRDWGYEMIKHDFSTYDVTGRWGFEMNSAGGFSPEGWAYADATRTTAEILVNFYRVIREAAGRDVLVIGCNVVGHLAAGLVDIQRIGDDTSASDWDRTRRMGVNTLAFRSAHQNTFYAADADCVPVSPHIPARLTHQWLDLVARSGTPLFLSIDPAACDAETTQAIRGALAAAVTPASPAEPLDWLDTAVPARWKLQNQEIAYDWNEWL